MPEGRCLHTTGRAMPSRCDGVRVCVCAHPVAWLVGPHSETAWRLRGPEPEVDRAMSPCPWRF